METIMLKDKKNEKAKIYNDNGQRFRKQLKLNKKTNKVEETDIMIDQQDRINSADQGLILQGLFRQSEEEGENN